MLYLKTLPSHRAVLQRRPFLSSRYPSPHLFILLSLKCPFLFSCLPNLPYQRFPLQWPLHLHPVQTRMRTMPLGTGKILNPKLLQRTSFHPLCLAACTESLEILTKKIINALVLVCTPSQKPAPQPSHSGFLHPYGVPVCPGARPEVAPYAVSHMELLDYVVGQACAEDQKRAEKDDKGKVLGTDGSPPRHRCGGSIGWRWNTQAVSTVLGGAANMAGTSYMCIVQRSVHV
jgi:hypothetical protein